MEFRFQHFTLAHDRSTMKIGTDAVLLATLTDIGQARSLLDIGCGCGVVAFCVAQKMQRLGASAQVYGLDPDEASVTEARENAFRFGLLPSSGFHFEQVDVQTYTQRDDHPLFDLVVSNPPFYHHDLKPERQDRLKSRHGDGQLSFEELVDSVVRLLTPDGRFSIILPPGGSEEFKKTASGRLCCRKTRPVRPTEKKPVYRIVSEYGLTPTDEVVYPTLVIRHHDLGYTAEYRALTADFLRL